MFDNVRLMLLYFSCSPAPKPLAGHCDTWVWCKVGLHPEALESTSHRLLCFTMPNLMVLLHSAHPYNLLPKPEVRGPCELGSNPAELRISVGKGKFAFPSPSPETSHPSFCTVGSDRRVRASTRRPRRPLRWASWYRPRCFAARCSAQLRRVWEGACRDSARAGGGVQYLWVKINFQHSIINHSNLKSASGKVEVPKTLPAMWASRIPSGIGAGVRCSGCA